MGVATAIAVVGAGIAAYGAIKGASNGQDAASAQGQIAMEQQASSQKAVALAAPTLDELQTLTNQQTVYQNAYTASQAQLSTLQQQITQTYGANIIEQGQQLHDQLLGANSVVTQQAQANIDRQRQAYQQQLISQLGPGAMSSSAGIQAMTKFDQNASTSLASIQETALNDAVSRLGGLQGQQSQAVQSANGINQTLSGMLGQIQNTQNMFQTRQINAQQNSTQYAGADQVGALQSARASQQTDAGITQIGTSLIGAGISGAAKSSATPSPGTGNVAASGNGLTSGNFNPNDLGSTPSIGGSSGMTFQPYSGTSSGNLGANTGSFADTSGWGG